MQIVCAAPLAALARDQEEQNNVEWLPKRFAHAHSVSGATQHCFAPLDPSRGRQEELHTQFARRMETKVVVATTWLSVGIDQNITPLPLCVRNNHPLRKGTTFIRTVTEPPTVKVKLQTRSGNIPWCKSVLVHYNIIWTWL